MKNASADHSHQASPPAARKTAPKIRSWAPWLLLSAAIVVVATIVFLNLRPREAVERQLTEEITFLDTAEPPPPPPPPPPQEAAPSEEEPNPLPPSPQLASPDVQPLESALLEQPGDPSVSFFGTPDGGISNRGRIGRSSAGGGGGNGAAYSDYLTAQIRNHLRGRPELRGLDYTFVLQIAVSASGEIESLALVSSEPPNLKSTLEQAMRSFRSVPVPPPPDVAGRRMRIAPRTSQSGVGASQ